MGNRSSALSAPMRENNTSLPTPPVKAPTSSAPTGESSSSASTPPERRPASFAPAALEEKLIEYRAAYKRSETDPFLSTLWASKLQLLEWLLLRLAEGTPPAELVSELEAQLPRLEKECARETEHPSFDWYDEHHHAKVLTGQCEAIREALALLERRDSGGV